MLFIDSMKKSKVMKKIERIMQTPVTGNIFTRGERISELFEELFQIMIRMNGYKQIIQKYNVTAKDIQDISFRLSCFVGYEKGEYLPVSLVSFGAPLDCLLENKEVLLKCGFDEVYPIIDMAISRL